MLFLTLRFSISAQLLKVYKVMFGISPVWSLGFQHSIAAFSIAAYMPIACRQS